ncbi:alpha/beta-type small acid-soluble spore protein [Paenibacillus endoradicis]|uniref:alpha/beta-type small acid-soluble spore protein n=1 Tax=Paenibacillus endoradicis TaxID=2972487 RepID=UPI002159A2B0|nr:alpha/beta-type small acid-soluble spore protein [Paenibacillus endoradicis]MCR8659062.1 alpha/beta-type small acid-soluble spore protein [Paenibacillus endoradicis]
MGSRGRLIVPEAKYEIDQMKFEIAQELGIQLPQDGYYGNMTTRDIGSIGGYITKRLVALGQQQLSSNRF